MNTSYKRINAKAQGRESAKKQKCEAAQGILGALASLR